MEPDRCQNRWDSAKTAPLRSPFRAINTHNGPSNAGIDFDQSPAASVRLRVVA